MALVPSEARTWPPVVCVVVDELRASSTITTLVDLGCTEILLTASRREARALARARNSILAGERDGYTPPGFDANNSPAELARLDIRGRSVVLCTTNGTVVIGRLQRMPVLLVGCLLNARACAAAALERATALGIGVGIVCAGGHGRFALEDAVTAGVIVDRLVEVSAMRGIRCSTSDAALASSRLWSAYPDATAALRESATNDLLHEIGAEDDLGVCAQTDSSISVPVVLPGAPLRVVAGPSPDSAA